MEKLIEILREFEENRTKRKREKWDDNAVAKCFLPCAEKILCEGYFLINGEYILDVGSIELYYHEETVGGLKDHAMYHTNERLPKAYWDRIRKYSVASLPVFYKEIADHEGYPYFKIGSFNLHQSGVDVTFENEEKKYRASFLIRSYRMLRKDDANIESVLYDPCSSHLYDDMNNAGLLSYVNKPNVIKWVENKKEGKVTQCPRRNLDQKPWQFMIEGLKEIK